MCIPAALCILSGCADNKTDEPPAAPLQADTTAGTEQLTEPAEYNDGLNAEELLRIRFTAVQPAAAEQIKDYYQALENDQSESLRIDPFVSVELTTEQAAAVGMNESVAMRIRNDVRPVISFNNNVEIAFNYTKKNNGSNVYTAIVFDAEANKKYAISLTLTSARAISYQVTEF